MKKGIFHRLRSVKRRCTPFSLPFFFLLYSVTGSGSGIDPMNGPWRIVRDTGNPPAPSYLLTVVRGYGMVYRRVLRPALSSGCPSFPSCSHYMISAIERYGIPAGFILGLERLLHESGEVSRGRIIDTADGPRVFDPLENNTFWWSDHD